MNNKQTLQTNNNTINTNNTELSSILEAINNLPAAGGGGSGPLIIGGSYYYTRMYENGSVALIPNQFEENKEYVFRLYPSELGPLVTEPTMEESFFTTYMPEAGAVVGGNLNIFDGMGPITEHIFGIASIEEAGFTMIALEQTLVDIGTNFYIEIEEV